MSTPGPSGVPEGRGAAGARGGPGGRRPQASARSPDAVSGPGAALQLSFCRTPQPSRPSFRPPAPQRASCLRCPRTRAVPPTGTRVSPVRARRARASHLPLSARRRWSARGPQSLPEAQDAGHAGCPEGTCEPRAGRPGAYSRRRPPTGRTLTCACWTEPPAPPRVPRPRPPSAPVRCLRPRGICQMVPLGLPGARSLSPSVPLGRGRKLAGMPSCPWLCSAPPVGAGDTLTGSRPRPGLEHPEAYPRDPDYSILKPQNTARCGSGTRATGRYREMSGSRRVSRQVEIPREETPEAFPV